MKKKSAVVFCGTSNHLFAMACVIMDLKRFSPNIADEILILHDGGVQDSDKKLINRIFATRFIEYNFPIQDTSIFDQGTLRYFSEMVYAKFECLKLLNDYKTILFLDYDIVITKDISELMSPCASGIKMLPAGNSVKDQLLEEYRNIKLEGYDLDAEGICGSTFVFQDNLKNYMEMYDFCYEKLRDCAKYLYTAEQAIFDFMIQKFNLQAVFLDPLKYTPHPRDPVKDASILHAYGQPKFWNGIENEQWQKNYAAWVEMGGTKYNTKQTPKRFFKKTARKINNMIDRGRFFVGLIKNFKKTRKNALIYNYFSSQQFKSNPWTFDQCKNYGKDFEKTFYDKNFAEKFGQLLSGLDDDSQKELKFIFLRMLWLAAFNRDSLYTENEIAAFTQTSEKKARKEKGYFLFEGFKFKNQNMTGHNFYNDMGLGLLSNTVLAGLKDKDVLDIGAYVGDSALMLSRYPVAHIYAFEPFDDAFDEIELLGFSLGAPTELLKDKLPVTLRAKELNNHINETVSIIGYLVTVKNTNTSKGERMCFGTFTDTEGRWIDTVHFPPSIKRYPFTGPGCYLLTGKVMEEFDFMSIEINEMHRLATVDKETIK